MLATPTWTFANNGQNALQQANSFPPLNEIIKIGQEMPQKGSELALMSGTKLPGRYYDPARDIVVRRPGQLSYPIMRQDASPVVAPVTPTPALAQGERRPPPDSHSQSVTPARDLFSTRESSVSSPSSVSTLSPTPAPSKYQYPFGHPSWAIEKREPRAPQAQRPVKNATGAKNTKKAAPTQAESSTTTEPALLVPAAPATPGKPLPRPVPLGHRLTVEDTPGRTEESWATEFVRGQYYALGLQRNRLVFGDSPGCNRNPGWGPNYRKALTKRPTTGYVVYVILSLVPGGRMTKQCLMKTACEWFPELDNREQTFRATLSRGNFHPYGKNGKNTWRNLMSGEGRPAKAAGGAKKGNQNKKRGLDAATGNVEEKGAPRPKRARKQKASPITKREKPTTRPSTEPVSEAPEKFVVEE